MPAVENLPPCFDPQVLARLQGLELRARQIVEGFVAGMHRSPDHGFSIEFAEHREYVPGDDLRYLDWKVFGKTDKFYLKQYEAETNLVSYLLLDVSESMQYQSTWAPLSKLAYAQSISAALSYLVTQQHDNVGLVTFDREIRHLLRPGSSPAHWKQLVQVMQETVPERKTAMGAILHELAERFTKRGIVVLLSDLFDDLESLLAGLKHLRHRRHEVVVFHVLDPAEVDFPFERTTMFRGLEAWPDLLTDPRSLRKAYLNEFGDFLRRTERGCRGERIDYVRLRTDQRLDVALSSYLAARRSRIKGRN